LRIVKRDDAKIEPMLLISSGDPDNHMHLLHILFHINQLQGCLLNGSSTHQVTASLPRFCAFRNVDESYARIICNAVLRPQLSLIDILRDKLPQGHGKTVCRKNKRSSDRKGVLITLGVKKICLLFQVLDVKYCLETYFA
jgi:hypothetical protein